MKSFRTKKNLAIALSVLLVAAIVVLASLCGKRAMRTLTPR